MPRALCLVVAVFTSVSVCVCDAVSTGLNKTREIYFLFFCFLQHTSPTVPHSLFTRFSFVLLHSPVDYVNSDTTISIPFLVLMLKFTLYNEDGMK